MRVLTVLDQAVRDGLRDRTGVQASTCGQSYVEVVGKPRTRSEHVNGV